MSSCNSRSISLGELRAKTDRQLLMLIQKQTQLMSDLLISEVDSESPKLLAKAEKAYGFAVAILPTITTASEADHRQAVLTLTRLGELLRRRADALVRSQPPGWLGNISNPPVVHP